MGVRGHYLGCPLLKPSFILCVPFSFPQLEIWHPLKALNTDRKRFARAIRYHMLVLERAIAETTVRIEICPAILLLVTNWAVHIHFNRPLRISLIAS